MRSVIVLLALLPLTAFGETAYVTDNLRLSVYPTADFSGSAVRTLESGQAFEVLSRDRLAAHVQLPDGATGYVRAAYIVYDPPAKLIVAETQAENERLQSELDEMRQSFAEPAALVERLQSESADLQARLDESTQQVAALQAEKTSLEDRHARYEYSLPITWVGGAILVCLVAGFLLGLWWTDRQSRRRHGGIRVY